MNLVVWHQSADPVTFAAVPVALAAAAALAGYLPARRIAAVDPVEALRPSNWGIFRCCQIAGGPIAISHDMSLFVSNRPVSENWNLIVRVIQPIIWQLNVRQNSGMIVSFKNSPALKCWQPAWARETTVLITVC